MRLIFWRTISIFMMLLIGWKASAQFDGGPGTTSLLIGQTFQKEFQDYVAGIGTAPAGSSHYAELYSGTINQGDDGKNFDDSAPYLNWINQNYPGATVLIAISIKDNPEAGGYGALNGASPNYDPNSVYKATKDIAYSSKWDANIRKLANKFKSYPNIKFMVRLGYEVSLLAMGNAASGMDFGDVLNIYNDQGVNIYDIPRDKFYNTVSKNHIDIDAYPDAFNKMAKIIREDVGASNVKFVFHPVRGFGEVKLLYPGDKYVDFIGFSIFNHDVSMGTDESMPVIRAIGSDGSRLDGNLKQALPWATAKKPVIIAEAAYQNAPSEWKDYISSPHNSAFLEYLDRLFEVVEEYDIRSLAYINSDWQSHGWPQQWADSRVEAFSDVKAHWMKNVINNSRYIQYGGSTPPPSKPLVTPTNLTTSVSGTSVTLNWTDNSTAEKGVKIKRKKGNGSFKVIYTGTTVNQTSYTDSNLEKGATYAYKVAAYDASTTTKYSSEKQVTIEDGSTSTGDCKLELGNYTLNFKEQGADLVASLDVQADDVIIDYSVNGGSEGGYWMNKSGNSFTYTISDVKSGDKLKVRVRVMKSSGQDVTEYKNFTVGNCGGTNPPADKIITPTNLAAQVSGTTVSLNWTDKSTGETGVKIMRKKGNGSFSVIYTGTTANQTSYSDANLAKGATYTYKVAAYNSSVTSEYSNTAVAKIADGSTSGDCTLELSSYTLTFKEQGTDLIVSTKTQAENVIIDYSVNGGSEGGYWMNKSGNTFTYSIANVKSGDKLKVRVRVMKNGGQDISEYKNFTVGDCGGTKPPVEEVATPSNLNSYATSSSVNLSWTDNSSAEEGHKIERKVGNGSFAQYATVAANVTSYTDNSVTKGETYSYRVYAYKGTKKSGFSNVTSKTITDGGDTHNGEEGKIKGKFTAKTGQTMLIIGQDFGSVQGYTNSGKFPEIAGITQYTNIYDLAGLTSSVNYGSGEMNLQKAMDTYPNSALSIGLFMVEDNDGKGNPDRLGRVDHPNGLTDIANGTYDIEIKRLAKFAKDNVPRPIFLRIGYEFDGEWNHYEPSKYIRAYNHIVETMNAEGVTNVAYVWQSATYGTTYEGRHIKDWYPNPAYVDYVGISFFFYDENFNGPNLQKALDIARAEKKPIMMAEVSAQYYELDQKTFHWVGNGASLQGTPMTSEEIWKQYWEDQLLPFVHKNDDVVRCVAYINADWQSQPQWKFPDANNGFWGDTRIEVNEYISQKWNEEIRTDFWLHGSADMLSKLNGTSIVIEEPTELTAPKNVSASVNSNTITVKWDAVKGAAKYRVSYGTSATSLTESKTVTSSSAQLSGLKYNQTYYMTVVALSNSGKESDESVKVSATTEEEDTIVIGDKVEGKFTPKNGKTLLAIGQDLGALAGYRYGAVMPSSYDYSLQAGEGDMPEPGAAVAYVSFYNNRADEYGINYGALGMDNGGSLTGVDSDWGSGPLNAASTADGWDHSALIMAMSITEHWVANGLSGIKNGQYDANIKKLAMFCKKYSHKKIFLRIGYEFDGRWNGEDVTGYGTSNPSPNSGGYHKREEYKAAWRHIVKTMNNEGVNNVAYVWQGSSSFVDDVADAWWGQSGTIAGTREDINDWYPGDDVVDWVGLSWFVAPDEARNTFNLPAELPNQDDLADELVNFARKHNKPVMICEATPQGFDLEISEYDATPGKVSRASTGITYEGAQVLFSQGEAAANNQFKSGTWFENMSGEDAWTRWFKPYFDYIHKNNDIIRAATYINVDWNSQAKWAFNQEVDGYVEGYWGDSRVETNSVIKEKWLNEIEDGSFWLLGSSNINDQLEGTVRVTPHAGRALAVENLDALELRVYPIPARDKVYIEGVGNNEVYRVYDQKGQLMLQGQGNQVDISALENGIYFLKARQQNRKIVKY